MKFNSKGLKELVKIYGPSGKESRVADYVVSQIKDYCDEITIDSFYNVTARKKGNGPKVMIAGHMDQIGLMITDVDDKGFLRVTNIGGINPHITHGARVRFENGKYGVVLAEGKANMDKLKLSDLFVDIGAKDKKEALKTAKIGDTCVYDCFFEETKNSVTTGALDDRIGCFVMIEAMKQLKEVKNDCYFVFSAQEEVGTRGGKMAAYKINPDIGLAVDITGSGDIPGSNRFAVGLHKGVAIKVRDNSLLSHPKVNDFLIKTCENNKIDYQMEVLEFGGTDAGAISLTREGIPASCLSIPTRYGHSPHETVSKQDVTSAINLLVESLKVKFEI